MKQKRIIKTMQSRFKNNRRKPLFIILFIVFAVAFTVPLNAVDGVPFLGVVFKDNTTKIVTVVDNSPAHKAKLLPDDIIIRINKEPVHTNSQLIMRVYSYNAGDTLTVDYLRNNKKKTVKIKLGERTDKYAYMFKNLPFVINQVQIMEMGNALLELGCVTDNLSDQLLTYFNVPYGIIVVHVEPASEAAKRGLKAGDIITVVNATEIKTTRDFRTILNNSQELRMTVKRHRSTLIMQMRKK